MRDLLQRKTLSLILVIAAVWFGLNLYRLNLQNGDQSAQLKDVQARIAAAQRQHQMLASSSAYFSSDAYLERQARLKLNYKMPDEQVAFVYPASSSAPIKAASQKNISNWQKWWYYLLDK